MMCIVNEDCVGIRDIETGFDNGSGNQHIIISLYEIEHYVFDLFAFHLAVNNCNPDVGTDPAQMIADLLYVLNPVMHKEYLAIPGDLIFYAFLDDLLIVAIKLRNNGHPVRRRSVDDRQIPCTHKRELESPWDWGCSQGESIHIGFQVLELFLYRHSEMLFLIDNKQAKILKFHILTHNPVGTYNNIDLSFFKIFQDLFLLRRFLMPANILH